MICVATHTVEEILNRGGKPEVRAQIEGPQVKYIDKTKNPTSGEVY
jgi:hypothetical protein